MSAIVINRLISGTESDNKLVLSSSSVARKMSIGTGWNSLRLSFRLSISRSGDLNFNPSFFFGLCSGTGNPIGKDFTDHFYGWVYSGSTWTYTHDGNSPKYNAACRHMGKTGTKYIDYGPPGGATSVISASFTGKRNLVLVEFTKTGPYLDTAGLDIETSNVPRVDFPSGALLYAMGLNGVGAGTNALSIYNSLNTNFSNIVSNYSLPSSVTEIPLVSSNTLDTICFSWNSSQAYIEISDVAYSRLA